MASESKIFGTSGIRGPLERVTPSFAMDLGKSLGTMLNGQGCVALGTDARTSRMILQNAFVAGVISTGVDVVLLGVAPMPTVASQSTISSIDVSVIITASHNPPTDNGFKFFADGREFVRAEEVIIEKFLRGHSFLVARWEGVGRVIQRDSRQAYLRRAREFLLRRGGLGNGTRLLIDLANGAATEYTPLLLEQLGFSVVTINSHPDGHFPGRPAEPSPGNLVDTMRLAGDLDVAAALCHDGDGDRLAVIDERGNFIDQNRIIALFAKDEVERRGSGTVVVSIDTSSVIDEVVAKAGGIVVRMPLGSLQERLASDLHDEIVFASEPWKPIFCDLGHWMDGIVGAGRIAQMIDEAGGSCQRLMASIPAYPMVREHIPCPDELKPAFMEYVLRMLPEEMSNVERVLDVDGVRVECSDGSYVLVRVSGTEPKARLYVGARTQQSLDRLVQAARIVMDHALEAAKQGI
ncbi:MAG: phosphoglucosamine mutase [Candidatus Thorarchaeota archaeon]